MEFLTQIRIEKEESPEAKSSISIFEFQVQK